MKKCHLQLQSFISPPPLPPNSSRHLFLDNIDKLEHIMSLRFSDTYIFFKFLNRFEKIRHLYLKKNIYEQFRKR